MNIKNLKENLIISNYKQLCSLLEIKPAAGNSKKSQLKDLQRYCKYTKDGNKFIILKVYDKPLEKSDLRKQGNNNIYVNHVKYLILQRLSTSDGYIASFTKNNLFEFLGMVNPLYNQKYIRNKLKSDKISSFDINNFFLRANEKLSEILKSSLKSLQNQMLINYKYVNIIVKNIDNNEIHTKATPEEDKNILSIQRETLLEMGYKNIIQVFYNFKTEEYYNKCNEKLKERYNIERTYKQYEIIYNQKHVIQELNHLELTKHRLQLNNKVINKINNHASKIYKEAENNYNQKLLDYIVSSDNINLDKFKEFKYKETYLEIQRELAEYLLRIEE